MSIQSSDQISRREFLKIGGGSILASIIPSIQATESVPEQFGRVLDMNAKIYSIPSLRGHEIRSLVKDEVIPITAITLGDQATHANQVWYDSDGEGYVHSSAVQPVNVRLNKVPAHIPETGVLAQVSVPYTDAFLGPGKEYSFAFRLYYETTHWIHGIKRGINGESWYRILDDKKLYIYFALASHFKIYSPEELVPISPGVPPELKRLVVSIPEQIVTAFENDVSIFKALVSTGANNLKNHSLTPSGQHRTFYKRPSRHMTTSDFTYGRYDLPGVPWVSYFTNWGIAFHGTFWHNRFGLPVSHGCVNLTPKAARWLYLWTTPIVPSGKREYTGENGTLVEVIP